MSANTRVTVVGETLVDLLWPAGAREVRAVAGGSPANVAVGLHRLGRPVTLVTTWGDDAPGRFVGAHLAGIGVDVRRVPAGDPRTTVALASLDAGGAADYDFLTHWDPQELNVPADTAVLHTGSLAVVVEPGAARVLELCERERAQGRSVAADLNVRPAVQPDPDAYRTAAGRLAAVTEVLKASDEDLAWLFPGLDPAEAARSLLARGPRLVVVTLGAEGALAVTAGHDVQVRAPHIDVVDTVGAGDTFQAALLDSLAERGGPPSSRDGLAATLARCVTAAALNCARTGADPPTRAELQAAGTRPGEPGETRAPSSG
ncbi:carbohydrate kinase [Streptomyces sp. ACA25]|uniref:carbohydrate kinase family protein n=1 Tax=Streptomyces sp. ACA25 TaxID=3022596 RepID=UPI002308296C|nr:carbohydrate kinase [Streptomyces sp. ACA25]MDB1089754.1 carbohydrate kinase [Streptomyces sp. ACA25]